MQAKSNNRKIIIISQMFIFKWRFICRSHSVCLSFLVFMVSRLHLRVWQVLTSTSQVLLSPNRYINLIQGGKCKFGWPNVLEKSRNGCRNTKLHFEMTSSWSSTLLTGECMRISSGGGTYEIFGKYKTWNIHKVDVMHLLSKMFKSFQLNEFFLLIV